MDQPYNSFEEDKKRFRLWMAGIFIGLILLAVAGWFGRSAYRRYVERRDQAQAQAFLARSDYRSALLCARETLLLNPQNVPAVRVMATFADLSHSPATLDWQRRIVQADPTVENKLQLAGAALRYLRPPFPVTAQILDELAPAATNLASYQVVAASLALSLQKFGAAEAHFEIAAALDPTNQLYQLNLAILRLGMTNESKAVASRLVLGNMRADSALGPAALRALLVDRLSHKDPVAANEFSTQLLAGPQVTLADQLQHLAILKQIKSDTLIARLQAVQQTYATNAPAVAQVAGWMQANGFLAESIPWLTNLPASLRSKAPVRLALADGYMGSADWESLRDFVGLGNWDDLEFLRLAIVSRAWAQLGKPQVADINWSSAVSSANGHYGALTTLLGLAEKWKMSDQRQVLLERIITDFPQERWAQQALAQLYFTAGKTAELNRLYARLFAKFPKDINFENNLAATALLLKTNLTQAAKWAAEAYADSPDRPEAASTYAFALHLQHRDQDGLAVLQKFAPRQLESPSVALYYGVLLAARGDVQASNFLQIARAQGQLLPEEQQLLAQTLGK